MRNENQKKRVGIFSPYIEMFGGGERYLLSIAEALSKDYEVFLYADKQIKEKSLLRFGIPLSRVNFLPIAALRSQNLLKRFGNLRRYDLFFYMTDGSLFFSGAKKNFLIVQSPLHIPKSNLVNNLKLDNWRIICYSQFMRDVIERKLGRKQSISMLAPCIDTKDGKKDLLPKENIILTVGRFFSSPHDKKHEMMLEAFKEYYQKYFSDWKLVIAGGFTEESGQEILKRLQSKVGKFPVEIMTNLSFEKLDKLYAKAKIYWHAAGFGEDLSSFPERAEHFGITPLEAMAHECVPLVFNGGGLRDIIVDGQGGYLWKTASELVEKTYELIKNQTLLKKQMKEAILSVGNYSCTKFYERLEKIIHG